MSIRLNIELLLRILFAIATGVGLYILLSKSLYLSSIPVLIALIAQLFLTTDLIGKLLSDVEKYIDCLIQEDYTFSIPARNKNIRLFQKTEILLQHHKQQVKSRVAENLIYDQIIENMALACLILRQNEGKVEIFKLNQAFAAHLQIPVYHNYELLKEKIDPILSLFEENKWTSFKKVITLTVNDEEEVCFLKSSVTQFANYTYLILTVETVQQLIDRKEKESWYKLLQVMSHEIINAVTPITSLAGSLTSRLEGLEGSMKDDPELRQGLKIIEKRAIQLKDFVNNYRQLTEIPQPQKKLVNITDLIDNSMVLFSEELKTRKIEVTFDNTDLIFLELDIDLISQVFTNLFSNSIYALNNITHPAIDISVEQINEKKVNIYFQDNGIGIPADIRHKIFIPYFTTREKGSGIGLTLVKSILEAHGGSVVVPPRGEGTLVLLSFTQ